jgi:hypothetical protein
MNTTGNRIAILLLGLGPLMPDLTGVPHADGDRIWVTRDGRHLRFGEMTTEHLRNTAAMLQQQVLQGRTAAADAPAKGIPEGPTTDAGGTDPHWSVRRAEIAAAMTRIIAARGGPAAKTGWRDHRRAA